MRDVHLIEAVEIRAEEQPGAVTWTHRPPRLARMDRLCVLASMAADAVAARVRLPSGAAGGRLSVVVGTRFGCHATNESYYHGLVAAGPSGASPLLFATTLPSSPLGEVTIHLGARGPAETVVSGRQAGLEAVLRAARLCEQDRADVAIAVAVEVGGGTLPGLGFRCTDGGVAIVLARGDRQPARAVDRGLLVGGATAFAAGRVEEARSAALRRALADAGPVVSRATGPARDLEVAAGDGAVDGPAALASWLAARPVPGTFARVVVSDEAGGAAALIARSG